MSKLTIKQAKNLVDSLGFTLNKNSYGEYVLRSKINVSGEYPTEYFGGDLLNAIETAQAITDKTGNGRD